jgi:hypothetical protein
LEKRIESEIKELHTNIRELDAKLTSLDNVVQHHARRREKMESLKSEVVKHEKELAAQRSTLEAQQSTTQRLLQGMEELRHTLEKEDSPRRREKVESLKSEVDNHEKELATQRSTLEAQQSTTQRVLQGMEELRHSLEKGDSQIQSCRSASEQNIGLFKAESRTRIDDLQTKVSRMEFFFELPTWKRIVVEMKRKMEAEKYLVQLKEAYSRVRAMAYELAAQMRAVTYRGLSPESSFWQDKALLQLCQDPVKQGWQEEKHAHAFVIQHLGFYLGQFFGLYEKKYRQPTDKGNFWDGDKLASCVTVSKCQIALARDIPHDISFVCQELEYNLARMTSGEWAYGSSEGSCYPWSWSVNAGGRKSNWVRGFSTFKGKVQAIREDIDSFEKRVVKALADIQCVLEVIRTYDLAQEGIVTPYKVLLLFRCEFQQGEEVSRKVKEALLQHRNTHIDSISRELYKGLGTPDWGTRSRSQTVDSAADHQASSWVFDFSSTSIRAAGAKGSDLNRDSTTKGW